jgi:hypothetical protein
VNRPASQIVRSRAQLEASALRLLRNAISQPGVSDDDAIAYTVAAMGKEHAGLVARVFAREIKPQWGAG